MKLRLDALVREKEGREDRRITQEELARVWGISQQTVSVLMRGENKQVGLDFMDTLTRYFDVPPSRLFEATPVGETTLLAGAVEAAGIFMLPVVGRINAGPLDTEHQDILDYYPWPTSLGARPGCFILNVQGDSMEDAHILHGSRAILDPKIEPRSGDIVAVLLNGESALKRLFVSEDGTAIFLSENREKNYPPIVVHKTDEAHIQGVVINIILTPESRRQYRR